MSADLAPSVRPITEQAVSHQISDTAAADYESLVRSAIAANKLYPRQAQRRRLSGRVRVGFRVQAEGQVDRVRVIESSGHAVLDKAAIQAVQASQPLARFPDTVQRDSWVFDVLLSFRS